jgi:hypothetical protein
MSVGVAPGRRAAAVVGPAIRDLLEHPIPLIAANVTWALVAVVAWTAWLVSPVVGVAASVLLAWPAAALAAVAGRVVRDAPVGVRDAFRWPLTRAAVPLLGLAATVIALVATVDLAAALDRDDLAGAAFATLAAWALLALGVMACVTWPLVGDPRRAARGTRALVRLATTVAFLHTLRVTLAALGSAVVLAVSAVLVAPLLTVSMGLVALLLCRVVLPLADAYDPPPDEAS